MLKGFLTKIGIIRKDSIEVECDGANQQYSSLKNVIFAKINTTIFDLRTSVNRPLGSEKKESKKNLVYLSKF